MVAGLKQAGRAPSARNEEAMVLLDDGKVGEGGSREPQPPAQRRADALLQMLRGESAGAHRYTLHLVADVQALADRLGTAELADGSPVSAETLRLACDWGAVRHLFRRQRAPRRRHPHPGVDHRAAPLHRRARPRPLPLRGLRAPQLRRPSRPPLRRRHTHRRGQWGLAVPSPPHGRPRGRLPHHRRARPHPLLPPPRHQRGGPHDG